MKRKARTLEVFGVFFGSGNKNERLLHLRAGVNQNNCSFFCGFRVRPIVQCGCTCIVTSGRLCFPVLVVSSVSPDSLGSFLLCPPASVQI